MLAVKENIYGSRGSTGVKGYKHKVESPKKWGKAHHVMVIYPSAI